MNGVLVDANVILDVFTDDPVWAEWSESALEKSAAGLPLYINPIIYAEISIGFARIEELEEALAGCGFQILPLPKEALFLAGKVFLRYRRQGGVRRSPLPDFFIGAHALVEGLTLLTRDLARFETYFPALNVISPQRS